MTFKECHVWYQIEGFSTGHLFIIYNFNLDLNWSKVIAKEGQKVILKHLQGLDESIFKCHMWHQNKSIEFFISASHRQCLLSKEVNDE